VSRLNDAAADRAYALGWAAVKRMPERAAARIFERIADRTWRRHGKRIEQLERNLCRIKGRTEADAEIHELSRKVMRSYLRYWLETFRLPVMSRDRIVGGMKITGDRELFATLDSGRGVVMALPHMGNYDQAGAWLVHCGYPLSTVAERLKPEKLFERFVAYRESLGFEILPLSGGASAFGTLARRLRQGRAVCLVADRDLSATGIEVEFFGSAARLPGGPAALAIQTGAALMPVTLWYEGSDWGARVHEEIPVPADGNRHEKTKTMTQALARAFEEGIAAHPEDWHMLHKVWVEDLT
jgi:KDO2-lipid IV(A) lauroyltransferase